MRPSGTFSHPELRGSLSRLSERRPRVLLFYSRTCALCARVCTAVDEAVASTCMTAGQPLARGEQQQQQQQHDSGGGGGGGAGGGGGGGGDGEPWLAAVPICCDDPLVWAPEMLHYDVDKVPCLVMLDKDGCAIGRSGEPTDIAAMTSALDRLVAMARPGR
ncbi:hypothetical protein FOA52_000744 [Chlamydomonas sp. UWO 241]|nr:hypothetical protein FOA52_000744 [Chlamydomonas sp. UWO 241]